MNSAKGVFTAVCQSVSTRLATQGFRLRKSGILTRKLGSDSLLSVGLNSSIHGRILIISPIIGVRHSAIEKDVAELLGIKYNSYIPATISVMLCYLVTQGKWREWEFGDPSSVDTGSEEISSAVEKVGIPFGGRHTSLEQLRDSMVGGLGIPHQTMYRLPVCYCLLGQIAEAGRYIHDQLRSLEGATHMVAETYRGFSHALQKKYFGQ